MKFELKTENDNFTKSIYSVFLTIAISFFIIIIFSIALEIRTISSHYEINFLCRLITVEKKSSNFKKLSKLTNQSNKQKIWDLCREIVK